MNTPSSPPVRGSTRPNLSLDDGPDATDPGERPQTPVKAFDGETLERDAQRLAYDAITCEWSHEDVRVRIAMEPFSQGALRTAHHASMLPEGESDWSASRAWVAKKYMKDDQWSSKEDEAQAYKDDVVLQMTAKHYGEMYDDLNPPKKVTFLPAYLIRTSDDQLWCIEQLLPNDEYIKHSTNSGFVDVDHLRNTPHAFSHFSAVASKWKLLIVDVQGVGDFYTDPQIHSIDSMGYGSGNLGAKGMAMFFYTHRCNELCAHFKLKPFDLYTPTTDDKPAATKTAAKKPPPMLRAGTLTRSFAKLHRLDRAARLQRRRDKAHATAGVGDVIRRMTREPSAIIYRRSGGLTIHKPPQHVARRPTMDAVVHFSLARLHEAGRTAQLDAIWRQLDTASEGVDVDALEVAESTPNAPAAWYHYLVAAHHGYVPALLAVARVYSGSVRDVLPKAKVDDESLCNHYLNLAAERGCLVALHAVAHRLRLADQWKDARMWYERILAFGTATAKDTAVTLLTGMPHVSVVGSHDGDADVESANGDDESCLFDEAHEDLSYGWSCETPEQVRAALAGMLEVGGNGLDLEPDLVQAATLYREAADLAMEHMMGKKAAQWYEAADRCDAIASGSMDGASTKGTSEADAIAAAEREAADREARKAEAAAKAAAEQQARLLAAAEARRAAAAAVEEEESSSEDAGDMDGDMSLF